MKKILGLDLGTASIGWAVVNEAENENEKSSIVKLGVRVIQYDNFVSTTTGKESKDPENDFKGGKGISPNAGRTLKRSARRNLQRYKLRKKSLIELLKTSNFISSETLLSENSNKTTFETYRLRAKAASEKISLEEFARVLLMINKKRGYKSSRKAKNQEEGQLIDGMEIAKHLYENDLTPGQYSYQILKSGKKYLPDFYRSDLQNEYNKVFDKQSVFYPLILTSELKEELRNKKRDAVWAICLKKFKENGIDLVGNKRNGNAFEQKVENYSWRVKGLTEKLELEEFVIVIQQINIQLNNSSGYLGAISDRSKELYFNKQTVGQNLMEQLDKNPHTRLKNQVFYRQDYLDEFEKIWETQAKLHTELNEDLKREIRDVIIFYQRKLKSQKGLISFCEFESREIEVEIEGKKKIKRIGARVCPKSSPLFQDFKIWQIINNIEVSDKKSGLKRILEQEEKEVLFEELSIKEKMSKSDVLKLLYKNNSELDLNYKDIEGNRTMAAFYKAFQTIIEYSGHNEHDFAKMKTKEVKILIFEIFNTLSINTEILNFETFIEGSSFENQASFKLWHLLYSYEDDKSSTGIESLISILQSKYGFNKEYATIISNINLQPDYGSLSSKAIRKIIPYLKEGNKFDVACFYAGYKHSKNSLTKEEIENKVLKDKMEILPKNSLRNPVVEKILNQMINVINATIDEYGKPDEVRIELARELKKSSDERKTLTDAINKATIEHDKYRNLLKKEFGLTHVSRNDIIRYKLYTELESRGYKTLYTNTYIPQEKLFSKEYDIEHIIPQSRLFDDSFSNKTLEKRDANIEKANETAYDYVKNKFGDDGLSDYLKRVDELHKLGKIGNQKYKKLRMKGSEIPNDFINRDLGDTQYIAKKAKLLLENVFKEVTTTTGSITDRLREDWQLIDVMQELNWDKYDKLGLTEVIVNREGNKINRIKDWTKRNDHRHHAMDALTVAFTKRSHVQYLNNLNARSDKSGSIYGIEAKKLERDERGKLKFKPPMPINEFRAKAKEELEKTLVSIKAKNKVVTVNINTTKKTSGKKQKKQLTPRGQLHLETVYGSIQRYITKLEKVGAGMDENTILKVANKRIREALLKRLMEFGNDPKKAFTGKNALDKNPIYINESQSILVPDKVKTVGMETIYTIRKDINPDLNIDKIIDVKIKMILENRLKEYGGDAKKAFSNLDENPIWLNEEKGISIKRVTLSGISNAIALHDKRDKEGNLILNEKGEKQAVDFVNTGSNHHVAIYCVPIFDKDGNLTVDENNNLKLELQENVVSFFEATERVNQGLPIIDKTYKQNEGWQFLFSMKQNEYFVFPNETTGFNPKEIDLLNPDNYAIISPNLFRVQTMSKVFYGNNIIRDYKFRHNLETSVKDVKELKEITYKQYKTLDFANKVVKIRINHIGKIVSIGEY